MLKGIKSIWCVMSGRYNSVLVLSFIGGTIFFKIQAELIEQLDTVVGFDAEVETLFCGNVIHDQIIQVFSIEFFVCPIKFSINQTHKL